jgi:hypothetical protein
MKTNKTIFSQLMEFIPRYKFYKYVKRYKGHYKIHSFTCWEQFLCMAFAQLTYRESLRDIEACLRSANNKLCHVGIYSKISRSTLAKANETRNWRIYRDLGYYLINRANQLYSDDDFAVTLKNITYALDSTTIDLCASLFPWAAYCKTLAAVKMHTLLNLRGNIPSVIVITDSFVSELKVLDQLLIEPGAIYILDRGYIDFSRFYKIHQSQAFFVTRAMSNFSFNRMYSQKVDKTIGIQYDQTGVLKSYNTKKHFPDKLRSIKYFDKLSNKKLVFLTNNMTLSARTIVELYRSRWQIELFFKWIKQHLKIKAFFGRTENAVKTQIWIAVSTYLLVCIVKKELNLNLNIYTILQILSVSLFEKTLISQALSDSCYKNDDFYTQLPLFTDVQTSGQ